MRIIKEGSKSIRYCCTICGCMFEEDIKDLHNQSSDVSLWCPNCGKICTPNVPYNEYYNIPPRFIL